MVPSDEPLKLTYRELADRLGISIGAARSRVRRAKQQGRWRVIPRNHPSTPAQIELPPSDLAVAEKVGSKPHLEALASGPGESLYVATLKTLNDVYRYVDEANTRLQVLLVENIQLKERLVASEDRRADQMARIAEFKQRCRSQDERLTAAALERLESVVEISKLSTTCAERDAYIERLELGVRNLQSRLRSANRPLWKKLLGVTR